MHKQIWVKVPTTYKQRIGQLHASPVDGVSPDIMVEIENKEGVGQ